MIFLSGAEIRIKRLLFWKSICELAIRTRHLGQSQVDQLLTPLVENRVLVVTRQVGRFFHDVPIRGVLGSAIPMFFPLGLPFREVIEVREELEMLQDARHGRRPHIRNDVRRKLVAQTRPPFDERYLLQERRVFRSLTASPEEPVPYAASYWNSGGVLDIVIPVEIIAYLTKGLAWFIFGQRDRLA